MFAIWTRLVYLSCPTKQDKEQGKVRVYKIQKDCLTLALVVNTTCTNKLKPVIIYKSLCPNESPSLIASLNLGSEEMPTDRVQNR